MGPLRRWGVAGAIVAILCPLAMPARPLRACGLVDHAWRLVALVDLPLAAPPTVAGAMAWLDGALPVPPGRLVCVGGPWWFALAVCRQPAAAAGRLASATWELVPPGSAVTAVARGAAASPTPALVLGADQARLRLAFFSDDHSAGRCMQIVLICDYRIRALLAGRGVFWAEERCFRDVLSAVGFDLPWSGRLISLTRQCEGQEPTFAWGDEALVRKLLDDGLVRPRQVRRNQPLRLDLPGLPAPEATAGEAAGASGSVTP